MSVERKILIFSIFEEDQSGENAQIWKSEISAFISGETREDRSLFGISDSILSQEDLW